MPLIFPHDGILTRRPDEFDLNTDNSLATGLKFADLGRFTGSRLCYDSSLYGNHGQLSATMDPAAWGFDGELGRWVVDLASASSQYITFGDVLDFNKSDAFSVSCFVKSASSPSGSQAIISKSDLTSPYTGWSLQIRGATAGNPFRFEIGTLSNFLTVEFGGASTTYQHISVTYDGLDNAAGIRAYVDGVAVSTSVINNQSGGYALNSIPFQIGRRDTSAYFNGSVSDILIHSRVLSPEIQTLANRSDPMLGGLIQPLVPRYFPVAFAAGGGADFSGAASGINGVVSATATVAIAATGAAAGTNGIVSSAATVLVSATGEAVGSNGVVASTIEVGDVASFSGSAVGTNGVVASTATILVAATGTATGTNGVVSSATTVLVSATGAAVGTNGVVVARIGAAVTTTSQGMMFMVC